MSFPFSRVDKNLLKKFFLILFLPLFFLFWAIPLMWGKDNIPPRVSFGSKILSGSFDEIGKKIADESALYEQKPIAIIFQDKKINTTFSNIGLAVDKEKTYLNLEESLRMDGFSLKYYLKWWTHLIWGFKVPAFYSINIAKLEELTGSKFNVVLTSVQEASLQISNEKITLIPAKEGVGVDSMAVVAQVLQDLKSWNNQDIRVRVAKIDPEITTEEAQKIKQELDHLLDYPFALKALNYNFGLSRSTMLSWVEIQKKEVQESVSLDSNEGLDVIANVVLVGQSFSESKKGYGLEWDTNRDKIKSFLDQQVQSAVYRKPINGVLSFENGTIQETSPSQSEITTDIDRATEVIAQSFMEGKYFINLPVKENPAPLSLQKVKELGIDTLIGKGESNFVGSPNNRKHNIGVGAGKFNGAVIPQGEEFSFLTTLGPVDQSTGYLPELVIKQDKTVPEFGGGMCQVSTTSFRAAVNSGLRVTERQNHAYPVQYYSPQGTDATVYIPHPDLKFVNDTPAPIIIQTRITGNILTFEYFGKSDGRAVTLEGPRVWDKKPDGSMKAEWIQKVFDKNGKLMFQKNFLSKYDSPSKYPHPGDEKPPTDKKKKKKKH